MDEVYKTANKASQLLESGACLLHTAKPNCTDVPHVRSVALAYGAFLHVPAYHAAAPCLAVTSQTKYRGIRLMPNAQWQSFFHATSVSSDRGKTGLELPDSHWHSAHASWMDLQHIICK